MKTFVKCIVITRNYSSICISFTGECVRMLNTSYFLFKCDVYHTKQYADNDVSFLSNHLRVVTNNYFENFK